MSKVGIISQFPPKIDRISMTKRTICQKKSNKERNGENLRSFHCSIDVVYINTSTINFGAFSWSLADCVRCFFVVSHCGRREEKRTINLTTKPKRKSKQIHPLRYFSVRLKIDTIRALVAVEWRLKLTL